MASWPALVLGGIGAGLLLGEAKVAVVEKWGGRISAYLFLKARNLRREHVSLRSERIAFSAHCVKAAAEPVVFEQTATDKQRNRKEADQVHNVIPLRRRS